MTVYFTKYSNILFFEFYKGDYNNEPPSHLLRRWKLEAVPELAPNGIIHPKQDIEITHQGCSWLLKSGGDLRTIGENV